MISAWIDGLGIYAPGVAGWDQAVPILRGDAAYAPGETAKLAPAMLPADVRRRTTEHIRLAVEVAAQAVAHAQADAKLLWSVFASSEGDSVILNHICEEVAKDQPEVSPTRFHNSVNNAAAGYWCMAAQSRAPSTSVAGFDNSFSVGLFETLVQVNVENTGMLLVAHDTPLPAPLDHVRPISAIFGAALVLSPERNARSLAKVSIAIDPALLAPSCLPDMALEGLRTGNPAARALPLLAQLARGAPADLVIPYVHSQSLRVRVEPA